MNQRSLRQTTERAGTVVKILPLSVVILGLAAAAVWYTHRGPAVSPGAVGSGGLSEGTKAVLTNLEVPVEIHFYALLDKTSVSADTFAFADRVNDLLTEYQQAGNGKVSFQRFQALSDANAAAADGITPFNLDKGNACFLGLAVICKGQKESFPQLSPQWEMALEADLSRAIARLSATPPGPTTAVAPAGTSAPNAAAIEDLKQALTNLATVSVADGTQQLRLAAFQEYQTVATQMEAKVNEARQHLAEVQKDGSETNYQDALKQLQQAQAEQSAQLSQIAARLQSRITALEQIKKP